MSTSRLGAALRATRHSARFSAAWAAAVTLAVCVRASDRLLAPALWAEDGTIFLKEAHDLGLAALVKPYGGYQLLLPRAVAALVVNFGFRALPLLFAIASAGAVFYVAYRIVRSPLDLLGKPLLAAVPVFLPHGGEVVLTLTNAQWVLAPLLVVLAVERPAHPRQSLSDAGALLLLGLTGPFSTLLAPLFWGRARRALTEPGERWVVGALGVTAAIQGWTFLHTTRPAVPPPAPWTVWLPDSLLAGISGLLTGSRSPVAVPLAMTLGLIAAGVLALCVATARGDARRLASASLLAAAILGLASVWVIRFAPLAFQPFGAGRYTWVPYTCLTWCAVCGAVGTTSRARWAAAALVLAIATSGLSNFRMDPRPALDWADAVRSYEQRGVAELHLPPLDWVMELRRDQRR